jgi:hypothetical protein
VSPPSDTDALLPCHGGPVTVTLEGPVPLAAGLRLAFRHHHRRAAGEGAVTTVLPDGE